jgi:pimeloyl-ACP methyl ester carboxylesterase
MKLLAFLCAQLMLSFAAKAILPDTAYLFAPSAWGLMYKEFKVTAVDNVSINAWFIPAQATLHRDSLRLDGRNPNREYKVDETVKKPTIIICDGDALNMTYLIGFAYFLCANGYNVVTFDWRGFGESQRWAFDANIACADFLKDYDAVVDAVVKFPDVDSNRIGAYGFSTGAYVSFLEFSRRREVKALAVRGMFTSYAELVKELDVVDPKRAHPYPAIFDAPTYSAISVAPSIKKPVFFIVGEHDVRTPPEMSIKLLSRINSHVRNLWIVKGAEHGGRNGPEYIEGGLQFEQRLVEFFNLNLQ